MRRRIPYALLALLLTAACGDLKTDNGGNGLPDADDDREDPYPPDYWDPGSSNNGNCTYGYGEECPDPAIDCDDQEDCMAYPELARGTAHSAGVLKIHDELECTRPYCAPSHRLKNYVGSGKGHPGHVVGAVSIGPLFLRVYCDHKGQRLLRRRY